MFLRFAVHDRDENSRRGKGVFTALYGLADTHMLSDYELTWFDEQEAWFRTHLKRPKGITSSPTAILWFKDSATEHISRMRALCALLEHKDIAIAYFETLRPGRIVYEDDHQVAAIPYVRETFS